MLFFFLLCFSCFFFFLWFCICYVLVFQIELERETPNELPLPKTRSLKQNHLNNLVVHSTINKDKVSIFQKDNTKSVNHLFLRVFQRYFTIKKFLSLKKNEKDFFISSFTSLHLRFVFIKKMQLSFMCRRVHGFSTNFSFYVDKIRLGFQQGRSLDFSTGGGGGWGGSNIAIPKLPT